MTLVESNKKKCSFLKDLIKCFKIKAEVINDRAENLNEKFDIIMQELLLLYQVFGFAEILERQNYLYSSERR